MSSYTYPQSGLAISLEWESKILLLNAFFLLIGAQLQLCIWAYSHAQYKVTAYSTFVNALYIALTYFH